MNSLLSGHSVLYLYIPKHQFGQLNRRQLLILKYKNKNLFCQNYMKMEIKILEASLVKYKLFFDSS